MRYHQYGLEKRLTLIHVYAFIYLSTTDASLQPYLEQIDALDSQVCSLAYYSTKSLFETS